MVGRPAVGTAADALRPERREPGLDAARVENRVEDQGENAEGDAEIGGDDEHAIVVERDHALSLAAACRSSVISRRRRISVRMRTRCRLRNRKVKASVITSKGTSMEGGMCSLPI